MAAKDEISKLNSTVYGNGKIGLVTKVELMEATMTEVKWWTRGIGAAIIFYVLNAWLGLLQAPVVTPTGSVEKEPRAALAIEATPNPTEVKSAMDEINNIVSGLLVR